MAKIIQGLILSIEDTAKEGTPDKVEFTYRVVSEGIADVRKGEIANPSMSKTVQQMYNDAVELAEDAEGIS